MRNRRLTAVPGFRVGTLWPDISIRRQWAGGSNTTPHDRTCQQRSTSTNVQYLLASCIKWSSTDQHIQDFFASRILLLVALCLSKVSVISFTRRIFSGDMYGERYIFGVGYAVTAGWGVMAVLVSSIGCHPLQSLVAAENALCDSNVSQYPSILRARRMQSL